MRVATWLLAVAWVCAAATVAAAPGLVDAATGEPVAAVTPAGVGAAATGPVRVALALPGGAGESVTVEVESRDAYGEPLRDPGWRPGGEALATRAAVELRRQSGDRTSAAYNLYLSEPFALTADPGVRDPVHPTLVAGDVIGLRLAGGPGVEWLGADELEAEASEVRSWRMDLVAGPVPEPGSGASWGGGEVRGVLLHSGEHVYGEVDVAEPPGKGPGLDFVWERWTRSGARYNGRLGRGWDSPYLARVRELPSGVVEHHDGRCRVWRYVPRRPERGGLGYDAPPGHGQALHAVGERWLISDGEGTAWSFNREGDLESIEDRNGNRLEMERDARGLLVAVRDSLGQRHRIEHDGRGRIAAVVDARGRRVEYGYDEATDECVTRTRSGTEVVRYGYAEAFGERRALASVTDEAGIEWLRVRYDRGRVVEQQWGGEGDVVLLAHDEATRTTTVTDREGAAQRYVHDEAGRLREVQEEGDAGALTTRLEWSDGGALLRVTRPEGDAVEYEREANPEDDPRRRDLVTVARRWPAPGSEDAVEEERFAYAKGARPDLVGYTDARGKTWTFRHDGRGNVVEVAGPREWREVLEYGVRGECLRHTGPAGLVVEYGHDAATGEVRSETVDSGGLGLVTRWRHDRESREVEVTNAAGGLYGMAYDERYLVVRSWRERPGHAREEATHTHDARGLPDVTTYPHPGGGEVRIDEDHEDALGQPTKVTVTGPGLTTPHVWSWTYDRNHEVATATTPWGETTRWERDRRGLVARVVRSGEGTQVREYGRDKNGEVAWESDPRDPSWRWTVDRDGHGRVAAVTSPGGRVTSYAYEPGDLVRNESWWRSEAVDDPEAPARLVALGGVAWERDDLGYVVKETLSAPGEEEVVTRHERDLEGRLVALVDPTGERREWQRGPTGWVVEERAPLGLTRRYVHDALGRLALRPAGPGDLPATSWASQQSDQRRLVPHRRRIGGNVGRLFVGISDG